MIIFVGIAGSGKTTQAKLLADYLKVPRLSTGQVLRENMKGKFAEEMLAGKIIDDDVLLPILDEELANLGAAKNEVILDGSPRTLRQAEWLDEKVRTAKLFITAAFHLEVSKEVVKKRLLARARQDDTEAAIAERFREYEHNILPILNFLTGANYSIYKINADQTEAEIAHEIQENLKYAA